MKGFLNAERYAFGPWHYFERAIARLLVHKKWEGVEVIGGPGDKGADIIGLYNGVEYVVQVKWSGTNNPLSRDIVGDVVRAIDFYKIENGLCISNRNLGIGQQQKLKARREAGYKIQVSTGRNLLDEFSKLTEWPIDNRKPRPYQVESINELITSYESGQDRGLICLATGMGKTFVACSFLKWIYQNNENVNILVLAERESLIEQFETSLWKFLPKSISTNLLTGKRKPVFTEGVLLSTFGSIDKYIDENPDQLFDIMIVDEAHHSRARTYENTINQLNPSYVLGLTATPYRTDRQTIFKIFGEPLIYYRVSDGIRRGFLSKVDYRLKGNNINVDWISEKSKKGYTIKQFNKKLFIPQLLEQVCDEFIKCWRENNRIRGIIFCNSVEHAIRTERALLSMSPFPVASYTNKNGDREKSKRLRQFRKGEISVLTTFDMLNEGVDVPDVDILCYMRVTHARNIFLQQLGRGLRLKEGGRKLIVLDYVDDLRRIGAVKRLKTEFYNNDEYEDLALGEGFQLSFSNATTEKFLDLVKADEIELDELEDENYKIYLN